MGAADDALPLWRLTRGDARSLAARLSCDQDIAADGFFSLGMLADFDASLEAFGPSFYRHLFWETGMIGQVLYLEAEAAGARATGIGCFYDDPVHDVLGLRGHAFQSLYHFTVGMPVDDARLTTEPGYSRRPSAVGSRRPHFSLHARHRGRHLRGLEPAVQLGDALARQLVHARCCRLQIRERRRELLPLSPGRARRPSGDVAAERAELAVDAVQPRLRVSRQFRGLLGVFLHYPARPSPRPVP